MVFADASALNAIIASEPDAAESADLLEADQLLGRLGLGDGCRSLPQLYVFRPVCPDPCPTFP
jgi:hypothetical protein